MKPYLHLASLLVSLLITLMIGMLLAQRAEAAPASPQRSRANLAELGDPYIPPRVRAIARKRAILPETRGPGLQAQALGKLQSQFDKADLDRTGRITQRQARQSGFGFVANHFDQIDTRRRGRISFGELKTFMRANGAHF
jgi:hypothetical protein